MISCEHLHFENYILFIFWVETARNIVIDYDQLIIYIITHLSLPTYLFSGRGGGLSVSSELPLLVRKKNAVK